VLAGLLALQLAVAVPAQATAGTLDPSFGTGGKVTTDFAGESEEALAVAVQDNGRIVAAGRVDEGNGSALGDFALTRYRHDGTLDTGFGVGGKVKLDFSGGGDDVAGALVVQADGRLVAGGHASSDWALARFRHDGTLDSSFGVGGKVSTPLGGTIRGLALQADGKLVAAGNAGSDFAVTRYNSDGSLDSGFGVGGTVTTAFGGFFNEAFGLVLQENGRIVAAGEDFGATSVFALARYRRDGSLDPGFGVGGKVTTDFGTPSAAFALVTQADGRLVAAGVANLGTATGVDFALARYRRDGSLDASFGVGGTVTTDFGGDNDGARAMAVQADGKLVAAGRFAGSSVSGFFSDFALARYRAS